MSTHTLRAPQLSSSLRTDSAAGHAEWLGIGLVVGFLVPFLLTDVLDTPRDLYYGIYVAAVLAVFTGWARSTGQPIGQMVRRRAPLAIGIGLVLAGLLAFTAVRAEDAGSTPDGLELVGALFWRGLVYGLADGLFLAAFPVLAVFAAFKAAGSSAGRAKVIVVAVLASMTLTAAYHAGYSDFRSDKLAKPTATAPIWDVATLATLNPIGSPIAHAGLHIGAVLHNYETDTFLPPH